MQASARTIDRSSPVPAVGSARVRSSEGGSPRLQLIREHVGAPVASGPLTEKTVKYMAQMIRRSASDPVILQVADEIKAHALKTGESPVVCLWWWVKLHVHFIHHDKQICQLLGECGGQGNYQMLIEPRALVRLRSMGGDCAVFTMLVDTLALALGFRPRIATVEADRRRPGEYTHVYGEVYLPDGGWCPLDASHGTGPGWEVPERDIARKTEWDLDGNIVADWRAPALSPATARTPEGLAGADRKEQRMPYVRRGPGSHTRDLARYVALVRAARNHGGNAFGMGQSGEVPIEGGSTPGADVPIDVPIDTGIVPDTTSGIDWTAILKAGSAAGLTATQLIKSLQTPGLIAGTQAIYNPQTGQFYNPQTGQVVNPVGVSPTSNIPLAGLTSSPLLLGGLALGGIVLLVVALKK